jgi:hypothetical protein
MTKPTNLPLYLTLFKLQKYLYQLIHNFRKEYKYTMGESILKLSWQTLDLVLEANSRPNEEKTEQIKKASVRFDQLKTRLRMGHELKLISHRKYSYLIEQNEEIGRMLNGWLRWAQKQAQ